VTCFLKRLGSDESGATAIEYGLIAALIALERDRFTVKHNRHWQDSWRIPVA